eukprot:3177793-Ditylum_brightwellii.AAC.1
MTCQMWINQISTINKCLPLMKQNGEQLSDEKIIVDVITPNLPGVLAVNFMKEGGDDLTDVKDVIKVLKRLEKADRVSQRIKAAHDCRGKNSDNKK